MGKDIWTEGIVYVKAELGVLQTWRDQCGQSAQRVGRSSETGGRALGAVKISLIILSILMVDDEKV